MRGPTVAEAPAVAWDASKDGLGKEVVAMGVYVITDACIGHSGDQVFAAGALSYPRG
jgi:hypothetical protein